MFLDTICSSSEFFTNNNNNVDHYRDRLCKIVYPIMKEINYPKISNTHCAFSSPIDPTMAWATSSSVHVCPLFVINLSEIPHAIRPQG